MNCDCINLMEVEILKEYEGKFQHCEAETLNNNFLVYFRVKAFNMNEYQIGMEVTYCPFCGKKVGK